MHAACTRHGGMNGVLRGPPWPAHLLGHAARVLRSGRAALEAPARAIVGPLHRLVGGTGTAAPWLVSGGAGAASAHGRALGGCRGGAIDAPRSSLPSAVTKVLKTSACKWGGAGRGDGRRLRAPWAPCRC